MRVVFLPLLVLALLDGPTRAEWIELKGKEAPTFTTGKWFKPAEGYVLHQFLGRPILLVFWSTATEGADELVFRLDELHADHFMDGLRVLGLTADPAPAVGPFLQAHAVEFPVASAARIGRYGSGPLPRALLIDAKGVVAWEGDPRSLARSEIRKHLRKPQLFSMPPVHDMLEKAAKLYAKGKLNEAAGDTLVTVDWAEKRIQQFTENPRAHRKRIREDADYILGCVSNYRQYWWRLVREGEARANYDQVLFALDLIRKHFAGEHYLLEEKGLPTDDAAKAASMEKSLRKDPQVKAALRATKSLGPLLAAEDRTTKWDAKKKAALVARYEKFVERHQGTWAAARAQRRLAALRRREVAAE